MATARTDAIRDTDLDKELADVLIAISVISKQLAKKIKANQMSKEDKQNVQRQALRTGQTVKVKLKNGGELIINGGNVQ